jgi:lysophospholipase-3
LAGSGLEAKLDNAKEPFWGCSTNSDWFRVWLAVGSFAPGYVDCLFHNLGIEYDEKSKTYHNMPGVSIREIDFGGLKGIDFLDYSWGGEPLSVTAYFAPLIADLKGAGYRPGIDLRGAPYDWRQPFNANNMFSRMKALIEEMFEESGGLAVNIVAHSFGNIQTSFFLNQHVNQTWKDKYIDNFISVAAPWSGAPQALRAVVSGDDFGFALPGFSSLIDPLKVRKVARGAGGVVILVPEPEFWQGEVLVQTPKRNYTVNDFSQLFLDMGAPMTNAIYKSVDKTIEDIVAPNVPLHCLYGINHKTEIGYKYVDGFDKQPEVFFTQYGDGVVPGVSLVRCAQFASLQKEPVEIVEFDLLDHMNVLTDEEVLQYILKIATHSLP